MQPIWVTSMDSQTKEQLIREITEEFLKRFAGSVAEDLKGPRVECHAASDIAKCIDHTLLKPDATESQICQLCKEAAQFGFATVCINPAWVELCSQLLRGTDIGVCTVVGFPLGASAADVKVHEARRAIVDGAKELDMVINVGKLKSGQDAEVLEEIRQVARAAHEGGARLKVIIETALLSNEEKIRACTLASQAYADFVKTSTGFGPGGATAEDVALIRRIVGNEIGVKAAGGIRDLATVRQMIAAGATRIGASASVKIIEEANRSTREA
jgi:deoxyribose-phosphate aldolase